ncbi:hypothetical protein ACFL35_05660 [Candidatus Riflebacteria bacterium]
MILIKGIIGIIAAAVILLILAGFFYIGVYPLKTGKTVGVWFRVTFKERPIEFCMEIVPLMIIFFFLFISFFMIIFFD